MVPHENPNGGAAAAPHIPVLPAKKDGDLLEEDLALKELLELYVVRAQDTDPGVQKLALESMRQEIRSATSSMTSVPKPLKFLRPHYGTLKSYFENMPESDLKKYMADILSVLALTMSIDGERESLRYRLLGSEDDIGSWGHEYVRNLTGQIVQEFQKRQDGDTPNDALMELVLQILLFYTEHNAEHEEVDLLMKLELYVVRAQDTDPGVQKLALESMRCLLPETKGKKKDKKKDDDLLEEDLALKEQLELYVVRAQDSDPGVQRLALEGIRSFGGEIALVFRKRQVDGMPIDTLVELVQQIVSFHMKHNAEAEAINFLVEVGKPDLLVDYVDSKNYKRVCHYLTSSYRYLPAPDDMLALDIAYTIYMKFEDLPSALRIALLLDDKSMKYVKQVYTATDDPVVKKQFSYIIAHHGLAMETEDEIVAAENDKEILQEMVNNCKLRTRGSLQWRPTPTQIEELLKFIERARKAGTIKSCWVYLVQRLKDFFKRKTPSDVPEGFANVDSEDPLCDAEGSVDHGLSSAETGESYSRKDRSTEDNDERGESAGVDDEPEESAGEEKSEFKEEDMEKLCEILDAIVAISNNMNMEPTPEPWEGFLGFPGSG